MKQKSTGRYKIATLHTDSEIPERLEVLYTGPYASGTPVFVHLELMDDADLQDVEVWYENLKGDRDVEDVLLIAGYDQHTNWIGGGASIEIEPS